MIEDEIFIFDAQDSLLMLARLSLAVLCGAVLGLERRERPHNPAGVRTMSLISTGAAAFMLISLYAFGEGNDATTVASRVVSGIGFLGGGIMFLAGGRVRNLTTAATFWIAAAIGLAAGSGQIVLALAATLVAFVLLFTVRFREREHSYGEPEESQAEDEETHE